MSRVTCHMSHVTCHVSLVTIFFLFLQNVGPSHWRVCYQWGLPLLVLVRGSVYEEEMSQKQMKWPKNLATVDVFTVL